MPSDYTESSFSECPCPVWIVCDKKQKVLPSPDIAARKVVLNGGLVQVPNPHSKTQQVYNMVQQDGEMIRILI